MVRRPVCSSTSALWWLGLTAGLVLFALSPVAAQSQKTIPPAVEAITAAPDEQETFVLVGAGDIVWCRDQRGAAATAKLIENTPGAVFALGDLVYDAGNLAQFQNCYD